jgi:hypothetical protein
MMDSYTRTREFEHCSRREGPNGPDKYLATLINRGQIDPFVDGVGASAMRAKGDRWDSSLCEKRRIHPEAHADHGGHSPEDDGRFFQKSLDDWFCLADAKRRPRHGCPLPGLKLWVLGGQVAKQPIDFALDQGDVLVRQRSSLEL